MKDIKGRGGSIRELKIGYRQAKSIGDDREAAACANKIGHELCEKGEYFDALKWFRIDCQLSASLPDELMPSLQSLGEVCLSLHNYEDALVHMVKHYELALKVGDVAQQQKASTQLARTHLEIYLNTPNYKALIPARYHHQVSLDLALQLNQMALGASQGRPGGGKRGAGISRTEASAMLADAYNNSGLLKFETDDLAGALEAFKKALEVCDNEEIGGMDATRSRIHNSLGRLCMKERNEVDARQHMKQDISICRRLGHKDGQVRAWLNLGSLHFQFQRFQEALQAFRHGQSIAKLLHDDRHLMGQLADNVRSVQEAMAKQQEFEADHQRLKKLRRETLAAKYAKR